MSTYNARELALAMGIGEFSTAAVIPYMFLTPATTDPDMGQVELMVVALQQRLAAMGAPIAASGELDQQTATFLRQITGPTWPRLSWATLFERVLRASEDGFRFRVAATLPRTPAPAEAVGFLPDLPDPGTMLILGALGAIFWFHRKKR